MIKNLGIIGGGTAGLITALILKKSYPKLNIDIIESDQIGIVGVGEGSTEHWQNFMTHCEVSTTELIKNTDCTFKYGINFDNWLGDNTNYFHSVSGAFNLESQTGSKILYSYIIANNGSPKDIVHSYIEKSQHRKPYWSINQFHFDTFKLNGFLHDLAISKNVNIINAEIKKVNLSEDGSIDSLSDGEKNYTYDLYVDCTGFQRLLLHKAMEIRWKSFSKYLPMNSAIAFPTERTEDIPSWTLSKALSSGWMWRIPTQNRFGNGYVFDDRFISVEDAVKEMEMIYGHDIEVKRKFSFDAGCLESFWKKNCVAIGLSSSFVEPLEASSIGSSIQQAFKLESLLPSFLPGIETDYAIDEFNRDSNLLLENILDYIALHYVTKRNDTEFWRSMKHIEQPDGLKSKLEMYKHKMPSSSDFPSKRLMFKEANWIMVMHGLGLLPKEVAQKDLDIQPDHILASLPFNLPVVDDKEELVDHRKALQWLINNPEQI